MEFSGNQFDNIAVVVAAVVALSLTLAGSLGPALMLVTEAIKDAFNVGPGKGGLIALVVAIITTTALALITAILSVENASTGDYVALAAIGALVGVFVGAGAINSHKAAATIESTVLTTPQSAAAYNLGQADAYRETVKNQPTTLAYTPTDLEAFHDYEFSHSFADESSDNTSTYGQWWKDNTDDVPDAAAERYAAEDELDKIRQLKHNIDVGPEQGVEGCDITPDAETNGNDESKTGTQLA